ncbi:MAG TPA: holo-ACP synthase [Candidatus Binataceae bacterium]|nr:holo-ACP synthase [Candidatus Binataceae bacterium]
MKRIAWAAILSGTGDGPGHRMARIIGTGIDVIEVERIERALMRALTGARFRTRVFTEREVAYCESRGVARFQSYAARFASKEAAMKAMGTGWNRNVGWSEIEVVRERGKAPTILLHGKSAAFAARRGIATFHLSITHTTREAIAHVIAEG